MRCGICVDTETRRCRAASLIGCLIECPLHFAQFDVRTGELVDGPVSAPVATYEVRVEEDTVYVKR